ncbi:class I SAM-dependent methyltransferase [candidate division WOR-3 bacterium]|nr:class I SAM-dependent methyltransferase [candidate division WOR-3 bacterium]
MNASKEYWEKRFKGFDFETFDFSNSKPAQPLVNFCKNHTKRGDRALDLGCGGGRNSQYMAQQGLEVYGVDISLSAVEFCRKRFEKFNLEGKFESGTFDKIPFPDKYFSFVVCIAAFDHDTYENAKKSIIEIRRVIAYRGLILFTFDPPDTDEDILDEAEVLHDGTFNFIRGEQEGMLFHRYKDDEIRLLVGEESIASFERSDDGTRVVVCH